MLKRRAKAGPAGFHRRPHLPQPNEPLPAARALSLGNKAGLNASRAASMPPSRLSPAPAEIDRLTSPAPFRRAAESDTPNLGKPAATGSLCAQVTSSIRITPCGFVPKPKSTASFWPRRHRHDWPQATRNRWQVSLFHARPIPRPAPFQVGNRRTQPRSSIPQNGQTAEQSPSSRGVERTCCRKRRLTLDDDGTLGGGMIQCRKHREICRRDLLRDTARAIW